MELYDQLVSWHWIALAAILGIVEILTFTTFLLWIALAALFTGIVSYLVPGLSAEMQLLLFAVSAIAFTILGKMWFTKRVIKSDQPLLNKRNEQYIGRVFTLDKPVVNGMGSVKVDDSTWRVRGDDIGAGATIVITGVDGVILEFEPRTT